jgi:glutamyl-tRNA synthetase
MAYAEKIKDDSSKDPMMLESEFKELATSMNLKPGELQLPFRVMLVGGKFGPPVFVIAATLGSTETVSRIHHGLKAFAK